MEVSKNSDCNGRALAQLLCISTERLRQLSAAGWIVKTGRGRYPLIASVQGYIKFLKDEERRSSKSAAASRVSDRRADEIEMRIEERSRALIHEAQAEALAVVDHVIGGLRADLGALPARTTADLHLRAKIEKGIDDAMLAAAAAALWRARCAADNAQRVEIIKGDSLCPQSM